MDTKRYLNIIHDNGKTCEGLAEYMGIAKNTVSCKLNGKIKITVEDMKKMCDFAELKDHHTICQIFLT